MTALPARLVSGGVPLPLGPELGRGGEATIHAVAGDDARAVKLYHRPDPERGDKLRAMLERAPDDPGRASGHVAIAWPEALVEENGEVVGFTMPKLDLRRSLPLHQLYHPGSRRRRAPGLDWRYLVRIARNLCRVVDALHRAGYVIGDLNESNILVSNRALVTLVDLDSVQVRAGDRIYRCPVAKAEYVPPELQGKTFREVTRTPAHDRYGLAILIFLLLMEGVHPFAGVYRGEGEPPPLEANMADRRSPYLPGGMLAPVPTAPPFKLLPGTVQRLMRRALGAPPWRRPTAASWERALAGLEQALRPCPTRPSHHYADHVETCPWCARREAFGSDAFAGAGAPPTVGVPKARALPDPPPPLPRFRGSPRTLLRELPVVTLSTGALGLAVGVAVALWLQAWPAVRGPAAAPPLLLALLLPATALLATTYARTRASPLVYRALGRAERLLQAGFGATLVALALSLGIGAATGRGSVLAGDWLLLPSLWLIAFALLWRWRRRRP